MASNLVFSNIGAGGTPPNVLGLTYVLSVTASNSQATLPTGFASGGLSARIFNFGAAAVQIVFGIGAQVAVLSTAGTPQPGYVIAPNAVEVVGIPATCDSFAAIGTAAGPSVVYVTRGDGL
jgi:hypothetical protein